MNIRNTLDAVRNFFTNGVNLDDDPATVKSDQLTYAKDVQTVALKSGRKIAAIPLNNSIYLFSIPDATAQPQIDRLIYGGSAAHTFQVFDNNGVQLIPQFSISGTYAQVISAIDSQATAHGYAASFSAGTPAAGNPFTLSLTASSLPVRFTVLETYSGTDVVVYTLQDAYNLSAAVQFKELASVQIDDALFVLSRTVTNNICEIGMAKPDINGTWTYTRLARSWRFNFPLLKAIDLRGEKISDNKYAFYWCDDTNKDKCFYVRTDYSTDCVLLYTVSSYTTAASLADYTYESIDLQTNLQLINNVGLIILKSQLQSGGGLPAGGYRYSVRFGLNGTQNTTEWSVLNANVIPVFKTSTEAPSAWVRIMGDKSGTATTKANVLTIHNAKPTIFNYVEVAAVYYAGEATNAFIVGKYVITSDTFDITHTGLESGVQLLDVAALPQIQPVIDHSKNLEIKKNRLNLSNVQIAVDDPDFVSVASGITLGQTLSSIANVGQIGQNSAITILQASTTRSQTNHGNEGITVIFDRVAIPDTEYNSSTGRWQPIGNKLVFISYLLNLEINRSGTDYTILILIFDHTNSTTIYSQQIDAFNDPNTVFTGGMKFNAVSGHSYSIVVVNNGIPNLFVLSGSAINIQQLSSSVTDFTETQVGEYQSPENCANMVGYMVNETYPFFFVPHMKSNYLGSPVYIGNYKFTSADALYQLFTDIDTNTGTLIYAALLNNINIASVRNKIDGFSIWRGECNPTVIGSGVYLNADGGMDADFFLTGYRQSLAPGAAPGGYGAAYNNSSTVRYYGYMVSPDLRNNYEFGSGDKLHIFAQPNNYNMNQSFVSVSGAKGSFVEYNGYKMGSINNTPFAQYDAGIVDAANVGFAEEQNVGLYNPGLAANLQQFKANQLIGIGHSQMEGIAMTTDTKITGGTTAALGNDNGLYMAQVIRPLANQYDIKSINIIPTGCFYKITPNTPDIINNLIVYGGDVYTQKTIIKTGYWVNDPTDSSKVLNYFITYYSQNRVNTQLFYTDLTAPDITWNLQGWQNIQNYLFPFQTVNDVVEEQFNFDRGFIAPNIINRQKAYNSLIPQESIFPQRTYYSDQKPLLSIEDFYRIIRPLNVKDLDAKDGGIVAMFDIGDIMFFIQPKAVTVSPYLSDVGLVNSQGQFLYAGNGGVYGQRESKISTFGSSIKTGTIKAQNRNGNSIAYWYDDKHKKFLRHGGDGIKSISDDNNIRSWLLTVTNFIRNDFDVVLGYDPVREQVLLTVRCQNTSYAAWNPLNTYSLGDTVSYGIAGKFHTFMQTKDLYVAKGSIGTLGLNPYDDTTNWTFIDHSQIAYYNEWTLIWNEQENNFKPFATPLPERYFLYNNSVIVPKGIPSYSRMYDLYGGTGYLDWFDESPLPSLTGTFIMEYSAHKDALTMQRFFNLNLEVDETHSLNSNPTVTISTDVQTSTINPTDFRLEYGLLRAAFKNDESGQPIINNWAKIRITSSVYIRILGAVTRFRNVFREPYN